MQFAGNRGSGGPSGGSFLPQQPPDMGRDLRQYARQTSFRLVIGFILVLFIIGDGLIYLFYGRAAAITGLLCLVVAFVPVILISIALWLLDWFTHRVDRG